MTGSNNAANHLPHWQVYLYGGLLFVYLVAENRSYQPSDHAGNISQVIGTPLIVHADLSLLLSALVIGLFVRRFLWQSSCPTNCPVTMPTGGWCAA